MSRRASWWLTVLAKIWPITWISAKATKWPVVGPVVAKLLVPLFSGKNLNITYIPINKHVKSVNTLLPAKVVEQFIRESAHRVIINKCTCRDARQCEEHPIDYGCTLLGEGTKEIDPRIARHVTVDEAIDHLHRTIEDGLVPMTGRVKVDNFIWGVRDRGKLFTICACCHCCCTLLTSLKYLPQGAVDSFVPLKGLRMTIDHDLCIRCGTCVEECHMLAISIDGDRLLRDESRCKGCGRCVSVCPEKAVKAEVEDIDAAVEELVGRLEPMADFR